MLVDIQDLDEIACDLMVLFAGTLFIDIQLRIEGSRDEVINES